MAEKLIMSWSECEVKIGKTGVDQTLAATLKSVGAIKDKSTTMESSDGDVLQAKKTGGKLVAREQLEGSVVVKTRIMEPDFKFLAELLEIDYDETKGELDIKSLIVSGDYSLQVTPKNIGATGIRARRTEVNYKEGYSEEEGHYGDLTFTILVCDDEALYTKCKKKKESETPASKSAPVVEEIKAESGAKSK